MAVAVVVMVVVHRSGILATSTSTSTSSEGWSGVRYRVSAVGRWPVTGGQNGCCTSFRSKLTFDIRLFYFSFDATNRRRNVKNRSTCPV